MASRELLISTSPSVSSRNVPHAPAALAAALPSIDATDGDDGRRDEAGKAPLFGSVNTGTPVGGPVGNCGGLPVAVVWVFSWS